MSRQGRDPSGRYREQVSLDDVREFFRHSEPMTAGEIAEALDVTGRTVLNKLNEMYAEQEIERKQVGARAVVWYREFNPTTASEVLAEVTGRPAEEFEIPEEAYPFPELDDLRHAPVDER